ncbi:MAG TPA: hypothetical protein VD913_06605 [bacterium]|nr:hypothetical protein [bacterium]
MIIKKPFLAVLLMLAVSVFLYLPSAIAVIALQPGFTGTIVITHPNGEIHIAESGKSVSDIPSESTLQVSEGSIVVATEPGDYVELVCLEYGISVRDGAKVSLDCQESSQGSGLLVVMEGPVDVTDPQGGTVSLQNGDRYPMQGEKEKTAPPTGADESTGGEADSSGLGDDANPDSRSIQSSTFE